MHFSKDTVKRENLYYNPGKIWNVLYSKDYYVLKILKDKKNETSINLK